jgi:hypothetical protein
MNEVLVGAGRFEHPTPCAQGIEALVPAYAATGFEFNEMACNRLQCLNSDVVDFVADGFLVVQLPALSSDGFAFQWGLWSLEFGLQ